MIVAHRIGWPAQIGVLQTKPDIVIARLKTNLEFRWLIQKIRPHDMIGVAADHRPPVKLAELVAKHRINQIIGEIIEEIERRMHGEGFNLRRMRPRILRPAAGKTES